MGASMQYRLIRLAKRLSIGRVLRYLDLWARYLWRRGQGAFATRLGRAPGAQAEALTAALAKADPRAAKRIAVASWFPLDLTNARLHRTMLAAVAEARPELGITPDILDCVARLDSASDLTSIVDAEVAQGVAAGTVNTALYIHLLRRLPAPAERAMIQSRHPSHALIAIRSGDEYRKQGRKTLAAEPGA
jgi:hypothetical protein